MSEDFVSENKETAKWISTILVHVMLHFKSKQFLCKHVTLHQVFVCNIW